MWSDFLGCCMGLVERFNNFCGDGCIPNCKELTVYKFWIRAESRQDYIKPAAVADRSHELTQLQVKESGRQGGQVISDINPPHSQSNKRTKAPRSQAATFSQAIWVEGISSKAKRVEKHGNFQLPPKPLKYHKQIILYICIIYIYYIYICIYLCVCIIIIQ